RDVDRLGELEGPPQVRQAHDVVLHGDLPVLGPLLHSLLRDEDPGQRGLSSRRRDYNTIVFLSCPSCSSAFSEAELPSAGASASVTARMTPGAPRRLLLFGALCLLVSALWLHREVLFGGAVYHMDDAADGYYPSHVAIARAFRHGELPTWERGAWSG